MRNPHSELRRAYKERLFKNITIGFDELEVKIYDRVPDNVEFPYIVLSSMDSIDTGTKSSFEWLTAILVDVVTGYEGLEGGKHLADELSNRVIELIIPERAIGLVEMVNYNCISTTVDNIETLETQTDTNYIVRNLIRFNNIITQK